MIFNNINDSKYLLKKTIKKLLSKQCSSFETILKKCDGLYPSDLKLVLNKLVKDEQLLQDSDGKYCLSEKIEMGKYIRKNDRTKLTLPKPHLYDFDWRFSQSTISRISRKMLEDLYETDEIMLIGAPSILVELLLYDPIPNVVLIDWNRGVTEFIKQRVATPNVTIYRINLLLDKWKSNRKMEKVFFDPPWYLEHYISFLSQASIVTQLGSTLEFALFSTNAKPAAQSERTKILDISQELGFSLQSIEKNVITYETPDFEKSTLKRANINVVSDWRTADLVTMVKYKQIQKEPIKKIMKMMYNNNNVTEWYEIYYNQHKIILKGPFDDYTIKPKLIHIEESDILPSVSRNYKNRSEIDLWISDNRVYKIEGKSSFLHALLMISNQDIPKNLKNKTQPHVSEALSYLNEILC